MPSTGYPLPPGGGAQGTGGASSTGGSRHPSCSSDGLHFVYDTSHTDLITNDNNGQFDPVLARFNGIDAAGTIDFSDVSIAPLSVIPIGQPNFGQLHSNGGKWPTDRQVRTAGHFFDTSRESRVRRQQPRRPRTRCLLRCSDWRLRAPSSGPPLPRFRSRWLFHRPYYVDVHLGPGLFRWDPCEGRVCRNGKRAGPGRPP